MGHRWFLTRDGKQRHGPFSDSQLRQMASQGKLLPSDLLWRDESAQWVSASSVGGLFPETPPNTELPEFIYAYLPFLKSSRRRITFAVKRSGTLTSVSKTVRTFVSGGGGGSSTYTDSFGPVQSRSTPISISTTHEATMDLWILDDAGRESSVRIKNDVPLKEV